MYEKEVAVYEDARNMANIATWGVELQIKRLASDNQIEEFVMQPVIDFHFLVTSLNRLRQAAGMVSKITDISKNIEQFDELLPDLRTIRNILEHIDEYRVGKGNNKSVPEDSFQTLLIGNDIVSYVGYEINLESAMLASQELFSSIQAVSPNKLSKRDAASGAPS